MSPLSIFESERLDELLFLRAGEALEPESEAQLDVLLARADTVDVEVWDRVAAAAHLALLPPCAEPCPPQLLERLRNDAQALLGTEPAAPPARRATPPLVMPRRRPAPGALAGWILAAAAMLVAALLFAERRASSDAPGELSRGDLLASASDLLRVPWSGTDDPLAEGVDGDVAWSNDLQRGFLRFENLRANDPTQEQYQLWIFDERLPESTPIDGGVFDASVEGDTVVAIDAKLEVERPYLFAVTLERPGGVVVSERDRLLLVAAVP